MIGIVISALMSVCTVTAHAEEGLLNQPAGVPQACKDAMIKAMVDSITQTARNEFTPLTIRSEFAAAKTACASRPEVLESMKESIEPYECAVAVKKCDDDHQLCLCCSKPVEPTGKNRKTFTSMHDGRRAQNNTAKTSAALRPHARTSHQGQ